MGLKIAPYFYAIAAVVLVCFSSSSPVRGRIINPSVEKTAEGYLVVVKPSEGVILEDSVQLTYKSERNSESKRGMVKQSSNFVFKFVPLLHSGELVSYYITFKQQGFETRNTPWLSFAADWHPTSAIPSQQYDDTFGDPFVLYAARDPALRAFSNILVNTVIKDVTTQEVVLETSGQLRQDALNDWFSFGPLLVLPGQQGQAQFAFVYMEEDGSVSYDTSSPVLVFPESVALVSTLAPRCDWMCQVDQVCSSQCTTPPEPSSEIICSSCAVFNACDNVDQVCSQTQGCLLCYLLPDDQLPDACFPTSEGAFTPPLCTNSGPGSLEEFQRKQQDQAVPVQDGNPSPAESTQQEQILDTEELSGPGGSAFLPLETATSTNALSAIPAFPFGSLLGGAGPASIFSGSSIASSVNGNPMVAGAQTLLGDIQLEDIPILGSFASCEGTDLACQLDILCTPCIIDSDLRQRLPVCPVCEAVAGCQENSFCRVKELCKLCEAGDKMTAAFEDIGGDNSGPGLQWQGRKRRKNQKQTKSSASRAPNSKRQKAGDADTELPDFCEALDCDQGPLIVNSATAGYINTASNLISQTQQTASPTTRKRKTSKISPTPAFRIAKKRNKKRRKNPYRLRANKAKAKQISEINEVQLSTASQPTQQPSTSQPTQQPSTSQPTQQPSTSQPTQQPSTSEPTQQPISQAPTQQPTSQPTQQPSTSQPTQQPISQAPTQQPNSQPTQQPISQTPTPEAAAPASQPTQQQPTKLTSKPTPEPTAPA